MRRPRLFRAESLGESLGIYLPTTAAARLLGLLRGVLLAWLLSRSEFGLLQIALLVVSLLQPFCSAGLNEAVARYVPQYETRCALRPFLARVVPMVLAVGAVLSVVVCLLAGAVGPFLFATLQQGGDTAAPRDAWASLTRLAAGTTFTLIAYFLLLSVLKGLRMFRVVSLMELFYNVAFILAAVLVAGWGRGTAGEVLVCYGAALAGAVLLFSLPLLGVVRRARDQGGVLVAGVTSPGYSSLAGQMLRFSVWAAMAAVLWQTLQYYPIWCLHKTCGQQGEVTAVFGGVRLLMQAVLIAAVAVVTVVQTSVTKTWESRGPAQADRQLQLAFKSTALVLLVACTGIAVAGPLLIRVFPVGYVDGAGIIPLLLIFFLVGGHLSFLSVHFTLIEKTRYLFWPWLTGVVCNVILGHWTVQSDLGQAAALQAAAWAGVLGISAALVVSVLLIRAARRPLDAGSWILLGATYALALPIYLMVPVVGAALLLVAGTNVILTTAEKQRLAEQVAAGRAGIRRLLSSRSA